MEYINLVRYSEGKNKQVKASIYIASNYIETNQINRPVLNQFPPRHKGGVIPLLRQAHSIVRFDNKYGHLTKHLHATIFRFTLNDG